MGWFFMRKQASDPGDAAVSRGLGHGLRHRGVVVVELLLGGGGEVGGDDGESVGSQGLEDNGGNQSKAAAQLGISRSTLWRYLKQLDEKRLV